MAPKLRNTYHLILYRKSLLTPDLNHLNSTCIQAINPYEVIMILGTIDFELKKYSYEDYVNATGGKSTSVLDDVSKHIVIVYNLNMD